MQFHANRLYIYIEEIMRKHGDLALKYRKQMHPARRDDNIKLIW